jgi:hypothetical protein
MTVIERTTGLAVAIVLGCAGCSLDAGDIEEPEVETAEAEEAGEPGQDVGAQAATSRRDCFIGCDPGWHPVGYYCAGTCGPDVTCTSSYNSTICEKDQLPQIDKCGLHGCPSGWKENYPFCDQDCRGSPGAFCTSGTPNATKCTAMGSILRVTDPLGQEPVHVGQPISIWGTFFLPNASSVTMYQFKNGIEHRWELPSQNGSYWWNGDEMQINTIIPPDVEPNNPLGMTVATWAWRSEVKVITPAP